MKVCCCSAEDKGEALLACRDMISVATVKPRLFIIHVGFILTGIVTTMLGPTLPLLAGQWHLNDSEAGRLFTAQFVSAVTGSLLASRPLTKMGAGWVVPFGMALIAFGVFLTAGGTLIAGVAGICVFGFGLGFALPATNLLMAEMVPESRVSALNLLNFSWTAGALAGPLLISWSRRVFSLKLFLLLLAAACLVIALVETGVVPKAASGPDPARAGKIAVSKRLIFAVLTSLFLIIYVGIENGFSGWLSVYSIRLLATSSDTAAIIQSSFWGAVLLGRLAASAVVRALSPRALIFTGLATASLGTIAILFARNFAVLEVGVVVCGFGLAALFPTVVATFAEWFGTGGAGSIVLGMCGVGGAVIPALVGIVATHLGSLRLGIGILLSCLLLAALTFWYMDLLVRPNPESV